MDYYKKAPKVYLDGSKAPLKGESVSIIPQRIKKYVHAVLDGKHGNQIKLIDTLLGTIGDGSFAASEAWVLDNCQFDHSCYIRARKSLVELGWIELKPGEMRVKIDKIIKDGKERISNKNKCHDAEDRCCDNTNDTCHDNTKEGCCDDTYNKEEYIINKEIYNRCYDNTKDIIFSRKEDIIILSRDTKLSESELKQIIISSNISDADDFIYFWKKINEEGSDPFGGYKDTKSKSFVLEKYNYYISKDKEYNIGDRLEDADFIIDNDSGHLRDIFFTKNFYMCNLSDEQISELKKLKVATYFFRRNDKNK
jgi:hypothetical protein